MIIKLAKDTVVNKRVIRAGQSVDVDEETAAKLIKSGAVVDSEKAQAKLAKAAKK